MFSTCYRRHTNCPWFQRGATGLLQPQGCLSPIVWLSQVHAPLDSPPPGGIALWLKEAKKCTAKKAINKMKKGSRQDCYLEYLAIVMASLVGSDGKDSASNAGETWVWSLGWDDPLEKEMATHSSILVWRILWTEEAGRLQPMGSQRVRHGWETNTFTISFINGNPNILLITSLCMMYTYKHI